MVYGHQCLGFWMGMHTLVYEIVHRGSSCTSTIRESALKVYPGRKISCCTGELNLRQHCVWHFGPMRHKMSRTTPCSCCLSLLHNAQNWSSSLLKENTWVHKLGRSLLFFSSECLFPLQLTGSHDFAFVGIFRAATSPSMWHRNPIAVTPALRATFHRSVSYRPSWSHCWN